MRNPRTEFEVEMVNDAANKALKEGMEAFPQSPIELGDNLSAARNPHVTDSLIDGDGSHFVTAC